MDWLSWIFLESFVALGALLVTVLFVLLVYWRRTMRVWPLLVGLGVAVVLLIVQGVVETRREVAGRILTQIERDFEAGELGALAAALAPTFAAPFGAGRDLDRDEFLSFVERMQGRVTVHWVSRRDLDTVASAEDSFSVEAGYWAELETPEFRHVHRSRWRLRFLRESEEWRIDLIEPVEVDGAPGGTLRELRP
jgi:hypothetical protein